TVMSPDQSQPGISDVHSGSDQTSSEGPRTARGSKPRSAVSIQTLSIVVLTSAPKLHACRRTSIVEKARDILEPR
ncbi:MAG TPA: hypothetical protein VF742_04045, partial [Terracidiphilus sp.]